MNSGFIKFKYRVKNLVGQFFKTHSKWFFISALFLFFGFCLGIFIVVKNNNNVAIDNIFNKNLYHAISGERGVFGIFFSAWLLYLFLCAVIIFLNFKPWMMIFTFACLTIYGYILGFNVAIMSVLFGALGIFNVIIIILPVNFCIIATLLIIASVALYRNVVIKKFGCLYYSRNCWFSLNKLYVFWFIIGTIFIILQSVLLPLIRLTIII